MPLLMTKDLPRYECLLEAAREFPDLDPSATEAFLHLLRTGDESFRIMDFQLAEHQMSQGRFAVLMALWAAGRRDGKPSLTPAELADRVEVTRATMTGLIDRLVRDGLVTRKRHGADRRMMSVALTAKGEERLRSILPAHFRKMAWLLDPLDESERKQFVGLLTKILRRASESTGPGAAPLGHAAR